MQGDQLELLVSDQSPDEMDPYVRLLSDAARGDASLFARQDAVEAAWRVVDPVVGDATPVQEYAPNTWDPRSRAGSVYASGLADWRSGLPTISARFWSSTQRRSRMRVR